MNFRRHRLRLETERHRIVGVVQLPDTGFRSRTTDFLNSHERDFIAMTDVVLELLDGAGREEHEYLAVSVRHIVLAIELESMGPVHKQPGPTISSTAP